jgi:hypothetical protein
MRRLRMAEKIVAGTVGKYPATASRTARVVRVDPKLHEADVERLDDKERVCS